jgi:hypothetical protein
MRTVPIFGRLLERFRSRQSESRATAIDWQAALAWTGWLAMLVWTMVFVVRYGFNLPAFDEWAFVKISYASWADKLAWLGEEHMEHRFPMARLVFLVLLDITGHDYRAAMWLSVGLLAAASAGLMLAARQLRGRTTLADIAFSVLLLHAGHTENILMGYQIAFTFTVCFLGVFALLAARSGEMRPDRAAWRGALLLLPIAMGGWLGLVFVPPLALWVAWQWWRCWRGGTGGRVGRIATAAVLVAVVGYLSWSLVIMLGAKMGSDSGLPFSVRLRGLLEVLGIGIGPGKLEREGLLPAGCVLLVLQALTAAGLAVVGIRRAEERPVAWGLLALLLGVWAFAVGVGYSRGSGWASRYSAFTAIGVAVPLLALARYTRAQAKITALVVLAVVLGTALQLPKNYKHAKTQAHLHSAVYASVRIDAAAKMPINILAERHINFWLSCTEGWQILWENQFPLLRDLPGPIAGQPIPATFAPDDRSNDQFPGLHHARVEFGGEKKVLAIRVQFRPGAQTTWEDLHFVWTDPTTGIQRRSSVRPWVRPTEIDEVTWFWIDGPITGGDLWAGRDGCRIAIISVGYLPRQEPGEPRR